MSDKDQDSKTPKGGKKPVQPDRDALDTFPLSIMPLASNSLKNAKLIKTARMETTVELHNDPITGSYQILPEDITENFKGAEKDQELIMKLSLLNSYDVFSLRNSLGKMGLQVEPPNSLDLSDEMKGVLASYTAQFMRPMIEKIFGRNGGDSEDVEDLQQLLRDPDVEKVRRNLTVITHKTGIPLNDIPRFIEEYNDVYLSVAYYRYSLDSIAPTITRFLEWVGELRQHRDVSATPQTAISCKRTEDIIKFLHMSIQERLKYLNTSFETFWQDINSTSFRKLRQQIEDSHSSMGAVLCGLLVKMRNWEKNFPDNTKGGPLTRAKFVVTDIEPGLDKLIQTEAAARQILGLPMSK